MSATMRFSRRSLAALVGVHPDLIRVAHRALLLTEHDFVVTEGIRSMERQRHLVLRGLSKTMHSRHLTGHAIDVVAWCGPGVVSYARPKMRLVTDAFRAAARELRVSIRLGIDWGWDAPHIELARAIYP